MTVTVVGLEPIRRFIAARLLAAGNEAVMPVSAHFPPARPAMNGAPSWFQHVPPQRDLPLALARRMARTRGSLARCGDTGARRRLWPRYHRKASPRR